MVYFFESFHHTCYLYNNLRAQCHYLTTCSTRVFGRWVYCCSCDGNSIGQNLYMISGGGKYPKMNVKDIVTDWFDEKSFFDFPTGKCRSRKMCGHYKQVMRIPLWGYIATTVIFGISIQSILRFAAGSLRNERIGLKCRGVMNRRQERMRKTSHVNMNKSLYNLYYANSNHSVLPPGYFRRNLTLRRPSHACKWVHVRCRNIAL